MIIVDQPYIYRHGNMFRLESLVTDEKKDKQYKIYYEVEEQYAPYLCNETADAFALALLPTATKTEQDLVIHANVSPKLIFYIREIHVNLLSEFYKTKGILVSADRSEPVQFHGTAFGTGCSLGVDSLSTIYRLTSDDADPGYRLTHLCYFGCAHLGIDGQETMDHIFWENFDAKRKFAEKIGLPLVAVNSSLANLYADERLSFDMIFSFYNASCVLALQKLFGRYAIASAYSVRSVAYFSYPDAHIEASYIPHFGTESMEIILTDTYLMRSEKVNKIVCNPLTSHYIDVCIATQEAHWFEHFDGYLLSKKHRNCGWCDKCLRTLTAIEALGHLEEYSEAFDIDNYYRHRNNYLYKTIAYSSKDPFDADNYKLIRQSGMLIPLFARFLIMLNRINPDLCYHTYTISKKCFSTLRKTLYILRKG